MQICRFQSKKEGRWKNPKPKTETLTPTPERKMGKERRTREKERGDPSAAFLIRQKCVLALRALGLSTGYGISLFTI